MDHKMVMKMVMEMVLVLVVVLMETPEGGGALQRWIPAVFPPSDLLRRQPSASLFLVLCFSAASFWKTSGDPLYSRF